jgi:hypothetical protein
MGRGRKGKRNACRLLKRRQDDPSGKGEIMKKRRPRPLTREHRMRMLDERIKRTIEEEGFFIMGVFPTEESPGPHFAYTVGLAPEEAELIMFGLDIETMAQLFQTIVEEQQKGKVFLSGRAYPGLVEGPLPLSFRSISEEAEQIGQYMRVAVRWHRQQGRTVFPVMQVIWPDSQGKFPWDAGFEERFREQQPLLGREPNQ